MDKQERVKPKQVEDILERLQYTTHMLDIETAHQTADKLLCELIHLLATDATPRVKTLATVTVDTFKEMHKWYA